MRRHCLQSSTSVPRIDVRQNSASGLGLYLPFRRFRVMCSPRYLIRLNNGTLGPRFFVAIRTFVAAPPRSTFREIGSCERLTFLRQSLLRATKFLGNSFVAYSANAVRSDFWEPAGICSCVSVAPMGRKSAHLQTSYRELAHAAESIHRKWSEWLGRFMFGAGVFNR